VPQRNGFNGIMPMDEIQKFDPRLQGVQFLRTELLTGITLSDIALRTTDAHKKSRNRANARRAFDAVLRFLPSSNLKPEEAAEIGSKLEQLKSDLKQLGEKI
jgi:hypothetical protein